MKSLISIIAIYLTILGIIGTGWVKNIIKLSKCDFKAPYKAEVIYGVGIVPMVGMVTGWLDIEDGVIKETNN